jgi:hypothetical protein
VPVRNAERSYFERDVLRGRSSGVIVSGRLARLLAGPEIAQEPNAGCASKIVGWAVHEVEDMGHAADLFTAASAGIDARKLTLHSDNGGPMKGPTMLATLQRLVSAEAVCID